MRSRQAVADVVEWTAPVGRRWQERDARAMARAYAQAGESVAAFARRHGLNEQRVRWWLGRLAELDRRRPAAVAEAAPFALVRVVESRKAVTRPVAASVQAPAGDGAAGADARIDVVIGGHVVRVGQGFCAETLRQIVSALAGGAC